MITEPQTIPYLADVAPETSLRLVDEALTAWLSSMKLRSQTPTVTNIWQNRQFAQNHEMLPGQPPRQAKVWPVVSLSMTGITPAIDRRVVANISRLGHMEVAIPGDLLRVGTNTTGAYEGFIDLKPIVPGTVVITAGAQTLTDNGNGAFIGNVGTLPNTVDYTTGRYRISFAAVVPTGTDIRVAYHAMDSKIYANSERTEMYILPFPLPFDIAYQIDLWTKTQQDMQALRTSLLCRFAYVDETYLTLQVPGYGAQILRLTLNRIDDVTDIEPGENDRELRNTVSITAHAWIYRVALKRKIIRTANVVFIDAGSDPVNLRDGSGFLDWYCDIDHYHFSSTGALTSVDESSVYTPPNRVLSWLSWP
jgi:hypothetical protein